MHPSSKETFRSRLRLKRRGLSLESRLAKSDSISKRLQESTLFQKSQHIHLYLANQDEVSTESLFKEAFLLNKKVAVPVIDAHKKMFFSALNQLNVSLLERSPFGIRQPKLALQNRVESDEIDLWIVPGLAFDLMGGRLGYGGGYYDRALAQTASPIIGLAFNCQVIDRLPINKYDISVDQIFTETNTIYCEENRRASQYH